MATDNSQTEEETARLEAALAAQREPLAAKRAQHERAVQWKRRGLYVVMALPLMVGMLGKAPAQITSRFGEAALPVVGTGAIVVIVLGTAAMIVGMVQERRLGREIEGMEQEMRDHRRQLRRLREERAPD